ncbi:HAD family hydrolase [Enterococcus sp. UD-01]|jgi:putative hydrolase of the HAD superfamily|uniref:HAD family hydrolase n=1 Tax=Enterococcus sp. UD-01 TaxID=3373911 RepID=UPI0038331B20
MDALIFDVDDTLYDQLVPFRQAIEKNFSLGNLSVEALYLKSRQLSDAVFHLTEKGEMALLEMQIYRIQQALAFFGRTISRKEAIQFQQDYQFFQQHIHLIPDVESTLDFCLQKKIQLGIITNGPAQHQRNKLQQLQIERWLSPERIFISSEVGLAKPDVRIFNYVQKQLGLTKAVTYYCGDSLENDVLGAKNAGWQAIWSNRRHYPPKSQTYDYMLTAQHSLFAFVQAQVS